MPILIADRVKETSTTTGTGTLELGGAALGFQTFVAGVGSGAEVPYVIVLQGGAEWEVGLGVVTDASPDTLTRATVLSSSNAGALVDFSAGMKDVILTAPASRSVILDAAGKVPLTQLHDWDVVVVKAADTSRASDTTLTDDPDLVYVNTTGEVIVIAFEFRITFHADESGTPDMKFRLAVDVSNLYGFWRYMGTDQTASAALALSTGLRVNASTTTTITVGTPSTSLKYGGLLIEGQFRIHTGSTFSFQWAQNTSDAQPTVVTARSLMKVRRVG